MNRVEKVREMPDWKFLSVSEWVRKVHIRILIEYWLLGELGDVKWVKKLLRLIEKFNYSNGKLGKEKLQKFPINFHNERKFPFCRVSLHNEV